MNRILAYVGGGLVAWLVLAIAVLFWQPGIFVQIGFALAAVLVAVLVPIGNAWKPVAALGGLVLMASIFYLPSYLLTWDVEFTVRGAGLDQKSGGLYLVQTDYGASSPSEPGETFSNQDWPLLWKFNSSDWDGLFRSRVGQRAQARVIGIRFANFSIYRNLISAEFVEGATPPPTAAAEAAAP